MASSTPPAHYSIAQSKTHHNHQQNPLNHLQKSSRSRKHQRHQHQRYPSSSSTSASSLALPFSPTPSNSCSSSASSTSSSSASPSVAVVGGAAASTCSSTNGGIGSTIPGSTGGICPSISSAAAVQNVPRRNHVLPSGTELGPEFRGARSTRVVSKRNSNRQRYSGGNTTSSNNHHRIPSSSAVDCLKKLTSLESSDERAMANMLLNFDPLLSGPDDYGFVIRGLGEHANCCKVVQCFQFAMSRMQDPTDRGKVLTTMISTLGKMGRADLAKEAFDVGLMDGYGNTVYAYSALISAYARCGLFVGAIGVFESMKAIGMKPNSVTYNTVIDACVKGGEDLHRTIEVFREMLRNGVRPDRITFNSLLAGCSRAGHWEDARVMFDEMIRLGLGRDVFTYNTFIDAICKCGNMELAVQVMSEMLANNVRPNVVTYSTIIDGYSKLERYNEALKLHEEVKALGIPMDRVYFNTLLSIYIKMGRYEDVVKTFEEMERLGIDRDVVTYNALIAGYGKQGRFDVLSYLTEKMSVEGIIPNVLTYSTLIDIYSKAGMLQKAMDVYEEFRRTGLKSDVVLYSSLIDTLCKNRMVESAVYLLNEMIRVGIQPNVVTYNSIINSFGKPVVSMEEDRSEFQGSGDSHKVVKVEQTAGGMEQHLSWGTNCNSQDLFCIIGLFQRMHHLGIKPNVVTFSSILNACSNCNSFEDASLLLEQLRSFDNRVYGVAHGLLMGSKKVWLQARLLFDDLKQLDSSTAAAFYNALTDMLWHFGQRQGAQLVVSEGRRRNVWENSWTDSCLDLHLMSSGASQAAVHSWLLNTRSVVYEGRELPYLVSILTGWGKHSKVSGSSTLRQAVEMLLSSLGAPFHVEHFNMGRFVSHGAEVAIWLKEWCPVNALILQDDRSQPEKGLGQLPNLESLKL